MQQGYSVQAMLDAGLAASPSNSPDYAKLVLRGDVPLDANDEGFEGLHANVTLDQVYEGFRLAIDDFERGLAAQKLR
jgi:hypothetical protein